MRILQCFDRATSRLLMLAATCFVGGAGVTIADILYRSVSGSNVASAIEITTLLVGLGALLSMPPCYASLEHITAKMITEVVAKESAKRLGIFGALLSIAFAGMIFFFALLGALERFNSVQVTPDLKLEIWWLWIILAASLGLSFIASIRGLFHLFDRNDIHG